jgi:hypothetical protein
MTTFTTIHKPTQTIIYYGRDIQPTEKSEDARNGAFLDNAAGDPPDGGTLAA